MDSSRIFDVSGGHRTTSLSGTFRHNNHVQHLSQMEGFKDEFPIIDVCVCLLEGIQVAWSNM